MAKAALTLANGTVVHIEGTTAEVRELLEFYGGGGKPTLPSAASRPRGRKEVRERVSSKRNAGKGTDSAPDLSEIVNLAKNCDEAADIEHRILDRAGRIDRTLLPLYLVHVHMQDAFGLSSGEIHKITTDLGVPVSQPNASTALSTTAAKYVIGDRVRKKGQLVRYKLSRRGLQYMQAVIGGKPDENAG